MKQELMQYGAARVPRYTSYPPATAFHAGVTETDYRAWLKSLSPDAPVALYLHVPYCREVCWYCACNMKLVRREQPLRDYAATLEREIDLLADALPARLSAAAIHWGGGTPTSLTDDLLGHLMAQIADRFHVSEATEVAFELDPRTFEPARAKTLASLGVSRVSLGVQEFDPVVQATVNRIQPFEKVRDAVTALRGAGITNINFDLMYGLPKQTQSMLESTIARTLELRPGRIALFGYAHVPWMAKRQTQIDAADLPGLEARFEQAEAAAAALVAGGYRRIGLDHFALPEDALSRAVEEGRLRRTFQGYSAGDPPTILGLGSSSISTLPAGFAQNQAEVGAWRRAIESGELPVHRGYELTREDRLRGFVIEAIMTDMHVDIAIATERFGYPADHLDAALETCQPFLEQGMLLRQARHIRVREDARPALRLIAAAFDSHFEMNTLRHAVAV